MPLAARIQFLAHVFEEIRLGFWRILADLARLRHAKCRVAMRREIAFIIHPRDELSTLGVFVVAQNMIVAREGRVVFPPFELRLRRPGKISPTIFTLFLVSLAPCDGVGMRAEVERHGDGIARLGFRNAGIPIDLA